MRLFIGIPLSSEVIDALARVSQSFRSSNDGLRWSSQETWHVTLQFLGETPGEKYDCLLPRLREMPSTPVPIRLGKLGSFDRTGVFFADVEVSPELAVLQQRVVAATMRCGFSAEDRPFHPHVTLARAKGENRAGTLRKLKERVRLKPPFPPFTAMEFLLYEAFLGPRGSRYEVRERFPLSNL